jgi:hypothetical protein
MKLFQRMKAWWRLYRIYLELGYIPWRKPKKPRKEQERREKRKQRKERKQRGTVYMGTREAMIPFLNKDAKRTIIDLVLRPGYLMRDYIQRGKHEQYLAPFTALLVFYSVFTLLTAVVQPGASRDTFGDSLLEAVKSEEVVKSEEMAVDLDWNGKPIDNEKAEQVITKVFRTLSNAILFTRLDLYPEAVDTPWKESLAAIEGDLRSKGIPLFLSNFLILWLSMALLLRKKYEVSVSGAAAASAYVLCQFCIFMFLALLITVGRSSELGSFIMGLLLLVDYHQWLQLGFRKSLGLTLKTGLIYLGITLLFYLLLGAGLVLFSLHQA